MRYMHLLLWMLANSGYAAEGQTQRRHFVLNFPDSQPQEQELTAVEFKGKAVTFFICRYGCADYSHEVGNEMSKWKSFDYIAQESSPGESESHCSPGGKNALHMHYLFDEDVATPAFILRVLELMESVRRHHKDTPVGAIRNAILGCPARAVGNLGFIIPEVRRTLVPRYENRPTYMSFTSLNNLSASKTLECGAMPPIPDMRSKVAMQHAKWVVAFQVAISIVFVVPLCLLSQLLERFMQHVDAGGRQALNIKPH